MIGHVFTSSGAVCLACAPSASRPEEYLVLARTETGYAVANLLTEHLAAPGGPDHWLQGSYFDQADDPAENLAEALTVFAVETGLHASLETLQANLTHTERVLARQHLTGV